MKENDWLVAGLMNPDYNVGQFKAIGMNLDNTQMLSKKQYLKSPFIQNNDAFKDDSGQFSEQKFDEYYNNRLNQFKNFQNTQQLYTYDLFDYRRFETPGRIKNTGFNLSQQVNPEESTIGIGWVNKTIESPFSDRERAEKNQVFDYKTGQYLDYSPNDHALFSNPIQWFKDIFREPLVMATWDEDGTHQDPFTGKEIQHKKGEKKINNQGKYYYETLGGRNIGEKQVMSMFDNLTVDGSVANQFDFFDSDDKEKSIGGTLMKGAATLMPLFIGGPVGATYSAMLVGRELMKALPMLDGAFGSLTGNSEPSAFSKLANNLAGKGSSLSQSNSDYANDKLFSIESLTSILEDVALQWGQQKVIAEGINRLRGIKDLEKSAEASAKQMWQNSQTQFKNNMYREVDQLEAQGKRLAAKELKEKLDLELRDLIGTEETWKESKLGAQFYRNAMDKVADKLKSAQEIGAAASLTYMAGISNADVYNEMLNLGCTKREAFTVALASSIGMYQVDTKLHLGELFFHDLTKDSERTIRNTLKNEAKNWLKDIKEIRGNQTLSSLDKFKNTFTAVKNTIPKIYDGFWEDLKTHSLGTLGNAIGEGLEEVSEDIVQDVAKQFYEWAHEFLPTTTDNVGAFGDAFNSDTWFTDILTQYGSDFVGGLLGGAVFDIKEKIHDKSFRHNKEKDNLMDMLMESDEQEVLQILDEYHKAGKLGSTKLGVNFELDSNKNPIFLSAESGKSQNDFVYDQLKNTIIGLSGIIKNHELYRSSDQLFTQMTLGEKRYQDLLDQLGGDKSLYASRYRQRYKDLFKDLINIENDIKTLTEQERKTDSVSQRNQLQNQISKLEQVKKDLYQKVEDFNSGENALDYMQMHLFGMDKVVSSPFLIQSFEDYLSKRKVNGIFAPLTFSEYSALTTEEQQKIKSEYLEIAEATKNEEDLERRWSDFKRFMDKTRPELENTESRYQQTKDYSEVVKNLFDPEIGAWSKFEEANESDFQKDAVDPRFKISEFQIIDDDYKQAELAGISRTNYTSDDYYQQAVQDFVTTVFTQGNAESSEDYNKRIEERLSYIRKISKAKFEQDQEIQLIQRIEDALTNAGDMVDLQTKRQLLLQLGIRKKDILSKSIKQKLMEFGTFKPTSMKIIENRLSELNQDLSNIDEVRDKLIDDLNKNEIEVIKHQGEQKIRQVLSVFSKGWFQHDSNDDMATPFNAPKNERQFHQLLDDTLGFANDLQNQSIYELDPTGNIIIKEDELLNYINSYLVNSISSLEELKNKNLETYDKDFVILRNSILDKDGNLDFSQLKSLIQQSINGDFSDLTHTGTSVNNSFQMSDSIKNLFSTIAHQKLNDILSQTDDSGNIDWNKIHDDLFYINVDQRDGNIQKYKLNDIIQKFTISDSGYRVNQYKSDDDISRLSSFDDFKVNSERRINDLLSNIKRDTQNNQVYKYISHLNSLRSIDNPVTALMKKLALQMNIDYANVEDLLEKLMDNLNVSGANDFTLSEEERKALDEAYDLLSIAKSLLTASAVTTEFLRPYPHNQLYNELVRKHHLNLNEMPEISQEAASTNLMLLDSLQREIGHKENNGYTPYSWRWWDERNAIDKKKQYTESKEAFIATRLSFWDTFRDEFQGTTLENGSFDLLDGIETISDNNLEVRLQKIELLFHENLQEIIDITGLSTKEILKLTGFSLGNKDQLLEQTTSSINKHHNLSMFTSMDRLMYLFEVSALNPKEFNAYKKESIKNNPNIAPLEEQEYLIKLGFAYAKNPDMYYDFLEFGKEEVDYTFDMPVIKGLFASGNGGAGKSEVVIRNWIQGLKGNVILSGPTPYQVDKLKGIDSRATALNLEVLFEKILGTRWNEIKADIQSNNASSLYMDLKSDYVTDQENGFVTDDQKGLICKEGIDFEDVNTNAIIIDEATHISRAELSILSEFCRQKKIPLLLVGDDLQCGKKSTNNSSSLYYNLNQEVCFIGKTPRLNITLRDSNYQKQSNNSNESELLFRGVNIPLGNTSEQQSWVSDVYDNFETVYYKGDEINGDYITDSLSDGDIKLIKQTLSAEKSRRPKSNHIVAYLGSKSSQTYIKLYNEYGDNLQIFDSIESIQGFECDILIVDKDWSIYTDAKRNKSFSKTVEMFKEFYTLSTRGKVSTIFVGNSMSNLIKSRQQSFKNTNTNFDQSAIQYFIDSSKNILSNLEDQDLVLNSFDFSSNSNVTTNTNTINTNTTNTTGTVGAVTGGVGVGTAGSAAFDNDDVVTFEEKIADSWTAETLIENSGLCYGSFSLRGTVSRKNEETGETEYIIPNPVNGIIRDVAIFGRAEEDENGEKVLTKTSKGSFHAEAINKLLEFKGGLLFSSQEDKEENYKNIFTTSELIDYGIDITSWKNKGPKFKIVISKRNPEIDELIGYSELDNNQMELGEEKYVYRIVAEFDLDIGIHGSQPNGQPYVGQVTLGAMANPETFTNAVANLYGEHGLLEQLQSELSKLESIPKNQRTYRQKQFIESYKKRIENLSKLKININNVRDSYIRNFNELKNNALNNEDYFEKEISDISFSGETELRYIIQNKYNVPKKRLGGLFGKGFEYWKNRKTTFRHHYPNAVISEVYIAENSNELFPSFSNISGRAVVFVSTNKKYKAEDLAKKYMEEEARIQSGEKIRHSVKMIKLDNLGVSTAQMATRQTWGRAIRTEIVKPTESGKEKKEYKVFPYAIDFMGARQLTGLWNFRINLNTFNNFFENELKNGIFKDLDYSSIKQKINDELIKLHEYYQSQDFQSEEEFRNYVRHNNKDIDINLTEKIWKFNDLCTKSDIKQFRLGVGNIVNGVRNGWNIRKILSKGENSNIYDTSKKDIYGIYLNPETLNTFNNIITNLFNLCIDQLISIQNDVDENENPITNISKEISYHEKKGILDNIENELISYGIDKFTLSEDDSFAEYEEFRLNRILGQIPVILNKITSRALAYSKLEEKIDPKTGSRIKGFTNIEEDDKGNITTSFDEWEPDAAYNISIKTLPNDSSEKPTVVKTLEIKDLVEFGETTCDLLSLIFHGTTDEFIDRKMYGSPITNYLGQIQAENKSGDIKYFDSIEEAKAAGFTIKTSRFTPQVEDAMFKEGFLVDPRTRFSKDSNKTLKFDSIGITLYPCATQEFLFGTSVAPDSPKFKILFEGKFDQSSNQQIIQDVVHPDIIKSYEEEYRNQNTLDDKRAFVLDNLKDNDETISEIFPDKYYINVDQDIVIIYDEERNKLGEIEFNINKDTNKINVEFNYESGDFKNGYINEDGKIILVDESADKLSSLKQILNEGFTEDESGNQIEIPENAKKYVNKTISNIIKELKDLNQHITNENIADLFWDKLSELDDEDPLYNLISSIQSKENESIDEIINKLPC